MDINSRIRRFCDELKIKQSDLAEISVSSKQTINKIFKEKQVPNLNIIQKILERYPKLNPRWLILGEGEMLINPGTNPGHVNETAELYRSKYMQQIESEIKYLRKRVDQLEDENEELKEIHEKLFEKKDKQLR